MTSIGHKLPVIYHGCGNVNLIFEDFIEMGLDAYNRAQGTLGQNTVNPGFDVNIAGYAPGGPGSYCGKYITDVISETSDLTAANQKKKGNGGRTWKIPS